MRRLLYGIILVASFFAPVHRLDIAKLLPVEAVAVYIDEGQIVLETDTKNQGRGSTVRSALEDLKRNTTEIVYLDTARYVLIAENAEEYAQELIEYLKPSVKKGVYKGLDVKEEAKYLDAHSESAKPNANN